MKYASELYLKKFGKEEDYWSTNGTELETIIKQETKEKSDKIDLKLFLKIGPKYLLFCSLMNRTLKKNFRYVNDRRTGGRTNKHAELGSIRCLQSENADKILCFENKTIQINKRISLAGGI